MCCTHRFVLLAGVLPGVPSRAAWAPVSTSSPPLCVYVCVCVCVCVCARARALLVRVNVHNDKGEQKFQSLTTHTKEQTF